MDNTVPFDFTDLPAGIDTPAFVCSEGCIATCVAAIRDAVRESGAKIIFAMKALAHPDVLRTLQPIVDGFAASSLFEAKLGRSILGRPKTLHFTAPGFRPGEAEELGRTCDYIVFNSAFQWRRHRSQMPSGVECGLRVNPRVAIVADDRYNPCRKHSKLGLPIESIAAVLAESSCGTKPSGIHFHTACDLNCYEPFLHTVHAIAAGLPDGLRQFRWINVGGGYTFGPGRDVGPLQEALAILTHTYGLEVFMEPGAAIVRRAGAIITTVLDLFESDGKTVAILDTTVGHMPEVFEYQYKPRVIGETDTGSHQYVLAGCSCLAGDLFGQYAFTDPLEVGSRLVFVDQGAYSLSKANTFNGIAMPTVYTVGTSGDLVRRRSFTYSDYLAWIGASNASS